MEMFVLFVITTDGVRIMYFIFMRDRRTDRQIDIEICVLSGQSIKPIYDTYCTYSIISLNQISNHLKLIP